MKKQRRLQKEADADVKSEEEKKGGREGRGYTGKQVERVDRKKGSGRCRRPD